MSERAHVTSIEGIESFRANLIVYLEKVRPLLEEVNSDLRRMRLWLETDRRPYWEREVQRRARKMEEARQNLFSARLSTFREATTVEQAAVHKTRKALAEAEEKLAVVKKWIREFGHRTEPIVRQLNGLDGFLGQEMSRGLAWLTDAIRALDAYAGLVSTPGSAPTEPVLNSAPVLEFQESTDLADRTGAAEEPTPRSAEPAARDS